MKFSRTPFSTGHLLVAGSARLVGETLHHCTKKLSFPLRISSANVTNKCKCNHFLCKQKLGQSLFWCSICLNIPEAISKFYLCNLLLYSVRYRCVSYQYDKPVTINFLTKFKFFLPILM